MTESDNKPCKSQADGKFCKHVTATAEMGSSKLLKGC